MYRSAMICPTTRGDSQKRTKHGISSRDRSGPRSFPARNGIHASRATQLRGAKETIAEIAISMIPRSIVSIGYLKEGTLFS